MNKAVFLDRDGVINRKAPEGEYITRYEDLVILAGVAEAIRNLNHSGYRVLVVTNQRGVAKGRIAIPELDRIHQQLVCKLAQEGATIHHIYYCPHDLDQGCECRKPAPGMLIRGVKEFRIAPRVSWMVGDSVSDVEAGHRAGCRTALVRANPSIANCDLRADIIAGNLSEAVQIILGLDRDAARSLSRVNVNCS